MSQSSTHTFSPAAQAFLHAQGVDVAALEPIPGDASPRRYWRTGTQRILAQVPQPAELLPFLRVQRRFAALGLPVPRIDAVSLQFGLLLQEDLGSRDLKEALDAGEAPAALFAATFPLLSGLAKAPRHLRPLPMFPAYDDARLGEELALFPHWYLRRHLQIVLDSAAEARLQTLFAELLQAAARQPKVWVHRDFHARNLLLRETGEVVMIDFQDAVMGPWTYDLASLLWDRYWDWGREQRRAWIESYRQHLQREGVAVPDAADFAAQVEVLALQRTVKILGIFCRLAYRDGKTAYLEFLPRFWAYLEDLLAGNPAWQSYLPLFSPWSPCNKP
ncbi:phosphotransferase [Candidatus Igneacidithiobacillus taiwanensis]|uniref:aminoglycoside phosphotransferase family protein n=1 Tax=Candidatus Igneacidithiobacillus taiwanensis TaxID=1945924 RepID=UPI0028983BAF|nr:phosphotransferase [Candidatus Igneacidithiobacillus taiwanensis]